MTTYKVFLTDGIDAAELDTETLDLTSTYQILDITNIGERKTSLKQLKFKGTKNNNHVFGSFFDLGRTTNSSLLNNLYYNYNPLRDCTALVYEDSNLIFKGTLRLSSVQTDRFNDVIYDTVLVDSLIDLKTALQDKLLSDLDFSDLQHHYAISAITNSWATSTERYNTTTSAYTSTAFAYGSGYTYPFIDYGYTITASTATTVNQFDARNLKPAIYVTEYLDRIFEQDEVSGFTYEVKGDTDFKDLVNHLIIPDCQEGNKLTLSGFVSTYGTASQTFVINDVSDLKRPLFDLNTIVHPPPTLGTHLLELMPTYTNVLGVVRNFTSGARVKLHLQALYSASVSDTVPVSVRFSKFNVNAVNPNSLPVLGKVDIVLTANTSFNQDVEINVTSADWAITDDPSFPEVVWVYLLVGINNGQITAGGSVTCTGTNVVLSVPGTANQQVNIDLIAGRKPADFIIPKAPANIKQIDFLKSFILQFNLIAYPSADNAKHLIFERYDDYYALFQPQYILANALDWSNKIDYTNGFNLKSNINLPKSYNFTYKTDVDYFTGRYQTNYNLSYGSLQFTDKYGLTDTKKIESIFSPIVLLSDSGTDLKYPAFYQLDSNVKKPTKTNIRMGYYNGLQDCNDYSININTANTLTVLYTASTYPQISNYYLNTSGGVVNNLYFNAPKEVLFPATDDYFSSPTSYENYYVNQTSELTNQDVVYLDCNILLNEVDIANLDLKVPVFINAGKLGASYFKVLKIIYNGSDTVSKVSLQRVILG